MSLWSVAYNRLGLGRFHRFYICNFCPSFSRHGFLLLHFWWCYICIFSFSRPHFTSYCIVLCHRHVPCRRTRQVTSFEMFRMFLTELRIRMVTDRIFWTTQTHSIHLRLRERTVVIRLSTDHTICSHVVGYNTWVLGDCVSSAQHPTTLVSMRLTLGVMLMLH